MKANAKNMAQGLVVSNESPIFALPSKYESTKSYIVESTHWAYPCSTSASCGRAYLAVKGGTPSLCTNITAFDEQCQVRSRVVWRSIVTRLHLVMSTASSRIERLCGSISKNPTFFGWNPLPANEKFADSKTLCTFAVRSFRAVKHIQCLCAYGRTSLSYLHCSTGTSQFSGVRPSFVHIANSLCYRSCEVPTQSIWRSIVTRLHLVMSTASSRIERLCGSISKNPTSFGWKFTVIRRRLYIAMLRLSRPARRYWRLVQQSSSSSDAVLPSASTISLSAAASSQNLKSFAL